MDTSVRESRDRRQQLKPELLVQYLMPPVRILVHSVSVPSLWAIHLLGCRAHRTALSCPLDDPISCSPCLGERARRCRMCRFLRRTTLVPPRACLFPCRIQKIPPPSASLMIASASTTRLMFRPLVAWLRSPNTNPTTATGMTNQFSHPR